MARNLPAAVSPMLATAGPVPEGDGWAYEFKWDGVRAIVAIADGEVRATSRNDRDITRSYPELESLRSLTDEPVLLDGELVTLDEQGRPDFGLLQYRMHVQAPSQRLLRERPVQYFVFDLLHLAGSSLLSNTYTERREQLTDLDLSADILRISPTHTDIAGSALLDVAGENGIEGIVAKRMDSRYEPGRRSRAWIKTPLRKTQEVIIGGWTAGQGRRSDMIGALLLGAYDAHGTLRFLGHVGTGFTGQALRDLHAELEPLARDTSPFDEEVPREYARRAHWVQPRLVGEVEHRQLTKNRLTGDRRLRHPSWRGLRPDKSPHEVKTPAPD